MKKILITGASGFVGGFLVDEALKRGLEVYAAVRKSSNLSYLPIDKIHLIYIDFEDVSALQHIFRDHHFDYIVHNAGLTKSSTKEGYFRVNCEYLKNITEALEKSKSIPTKFTFISSLAAYGPADYTNRGIINSDEKPHPVTDYGRSKLAAEKYLASKRDVLNYSIVRPTAVYGPREKDLFTMYELINKGFSLKVGLKDQKLTFIYVKDLVRIIIDATLNKKEHTEYFVSDTHIVNSSNYNKAIQNALGKKVVFPLRIPIPVLKVIGVIAEQIGKFTNSYPPLNKEKVNELKAKSWICDTSALIEDLNFVPEYDIHKGLEESIQWYRENNWL